MCGTYELYNIYYWGGVDAWLGIPTFPVEISPWWPQYYTWRMYCSFWSYHQRIWGMIWIRSGAGIGIGSGDRSRGLYHRWRGPHARGNTGIVIPGPVLLQTILPKVRRQSPGMLGTYHWCYTHAWITHLWTLPLVCHSMGRGVVWLAVLPLALLWMQACWGLALVSCWSLLETRIKHG